MDFPSQYLNGLVQDYGISSADAQEIPQSCHSAVTFPQ